MFFCKCLNVFCELNNNGTQKQAAIKKSPINSQRSITDSSFEVLDFLRSAMGPYSGATIKVQQDVLMQKSRLDKWTLHKCLNCDSYVYATADNADEMLINAQLLRDNDNSLLRTMSSDKNFSLPFKVILKPMGIDESNISSINMTINDDPRIKCVFGKLQDYIAKETSDTEVEIRRLTLQLNQRRQQAERDFQQIVTLINSVENTEQSTNQMSTDITPPVTPESAQMSMEDHHKTLMAAKNPRDGIAKHNNALLQKQVVTRTIDFDDDIFELDGMQEDVAPKNDDFDHYHKYSDTETSDIEEMPERRPQRVRSGSACIARSAPISMPQFLHANIHREDKRDILNENDIASSIKLLAKSIHADSVFGELPVRPIFKYNTDF